MCKPEQGYYGNRELEHVVYTEDGRIPYEKYKEYLINKHGEEEGQRLFSLNEKLDNLFKI